MSGRARLDHAALCWGLVLDGEPVETPSGMIGFGRRAGHPAVVKVSGASADEAMGPRALRHFGAERAVTVLALNEGQRAVLLERALPGTPLSRLVLDGADDEATAVLCDVMTGLHRPLAPADGFPSVEDWGHCFERYRESGDTTVAATTIEHARALFVELSATQDDRRLLHGDLHHDNVLWDERRGWLAIDPKGVVGEPAYEVGAVLRNPTEDARHFADRRIVERRIGAFERRRGFARDRMVAWGYAQAVLSALWSLEDGLDPSRGLATARALRPMV